MNASVSVIENILEIGLKKPGEFYKLAEDCFFPCILEEGGVLAGSRHFLANSKYQHRSQRLYWQ